MDHEKPLILQFSRELMIDYIRAMCWIFSICPSKFVLHLLYLVSCPEKLNCMKYTKKISCPLASGSLWPMKGPCRRLEIRRRMRSGYLFPQFPPFCSASGWLCPSSEVHTTLKFTFCTRLSFQVSSLGPHLFRSPGCDSFALTRVSLFFVPCGFSIFYSMWVLCNHPFVNHSSSNYPNLNVSHVSCQYPHHHRW